MLVKNNIRGTAFAGLDPDTGEETFANYGEVAEVDEALGKALLAKGHSRGVADDSLDEAKAALASDDYHAMRSAAADLDLEPESSSKDDLRAALEAAVEG